MILISHRGNLYGPQQEKENTPEYIKFALDMGFECEIDVWRFNDQIFLGHDKPEHFVEESWFEDKLLWCHAKNKDALHWLLEKGYNCFWHQDDKFTITSHLHVWAYPSPSSYRRAINVMPENHALSSENLAGCLGICSDYIASYQ